jgi:hypothetical protein
MKKNNGQPFIMGSNGKQIAEYIQQRKEEYSYIVKGVKRCFILANNSKCTSHH